MNSEHKWDDKGLKAAWDKLSDYPEGNDIKEIIQAYLDASGAKIVERWNPSRERPGGKT